MLGERSLMRTQAIVMGFLAGFFGTAVIGGLVGVVAAGPIGALYGAAFAGVVCGLPAALISALLCWLLACRMERAGTSAPSIVLGFELLGAAVGPVLALIPFVVMGADFGGQIGWIVLIAALAAAVAVFGGRAVGRQVADASAGGPLPA